MSGRLMRFAACVLFSVFASIAGAATPAEIPQATSLLVDDAGALTDDERKALLGRLREFQDAGRAQIAILLSKGTDGAPLAEYSLRVAESWKLGRAGRDDGLLIVVVPSTGAVRVEVGYGLEGNIPDAKVAQWLDDLQPAVKRNEVAGGLDQLLDRIDRVLPKAASKSGSGDNFLFPDHPEWRLPFVLVVFSLFAIFPMFAGRWGSYASAPLLAAFWGGAAFSYWGPSPAAYAITGVAFALPLLWRLNLSGRKAPRWVEYLKGFGNLMAVVAFFTILTVFVGAPLSAEAKEFVWAAPAFAALLSIALAVFLFPSYARPIMVVLRSFIHFIFIVVLVYACLQAFVADAGRIATIVAATVTALIAIGLYVDSRQAPSAGFRTAHWFYGLALLLIIPCGLFALLLAAGGEDLQTQIVQGVAGGGSIAGALAIAARLGLIAAVRVGLGGAFGGGGAGRD
ncbi:MAG: YgcG family protein [Betaproteobacteria bacterium]|nr:YgcG family protein [Betaproteobacteria bacterium]